MKAEIFEYSGWFTCTDDIQFARELDRLVKISGHTVIHYKEHLFEPQGLTALWLLAESHLAMHTWPEEQKAYVQLSSCSNGKFDVLTQELAKAFKAVEN